MTFFIAWSALALLIFAYGLWDASSPEPWEDPDYEEILRKQLEER